MARSNKNYIQIIVFSTILVFVPMFVFPAKLGMELAVGSFTYSMFEIVFYGAVFYLFRTQSSLLQLMAGAGLTFLYRIFLGTVFGLLVAMSYQMDLSVALALGVSRYLPAILLQVIGAPFVMRPLFLSIFDIQSSRSRSRVSKVSTPRQTQLEKPGKKAIKPSMTSGPSLHSTGLGRAITEADKDATSVGYETNGFDRAVKYLGEHHAVRLAAVVDYEGLTLASFSRRIDDVGRWAAYAPLFQNANNDLLERFGRDGRMSDFEMSFGQNKLSLIQVHDFSLLVLANKEEDDLLNIRITQAAEMIRKYYSERYGDLLPQGTEERYVSST
jgi:predicted regulator of Ras-like GTPase activity (Roadblock/LC7/MglB family)